MTIRRRIGHTILFAIFVGATFYSIFQLTRLTNYLSFKEGVNLGLSRCSAQQQKQTGIYLGPSGVIEGLSLEDTSYRHRDRAP